MEQQPAADDRSELELEAERSGDPFLLLETDSGPRVVVLQPGSRLRLGRGPNVDLDLGADTEISRVHADIRHDGGRWGVLDDEQSRNGTFVNERRVRGWQELEDGDSLRLGRTEIRFRDPAREPDPEPVAEPAGEERGPVALSGEERELLVALCAPLAYAREGAEPATADELTGRLGREVSEIVADIDRLSERFGVGGSNLERREGLAESALRAGIVTPRELETA
ncbi:FHA domain-containing protein [Thermoleophilia bacterium SCSIO 60948]|nr:FHA domain-containing protein [Thermoleophilia bacterium SCSIO 60948]